MSDDNKISFELDLDLKEFTEQGLKAKGIIEKLGSKDSVAGLIEGLTQVGSILGVAGIAAFAFKEAIDLTLQGEEIERINNQFEVLATQAGIAPKELKEGLEQAGRGLVDTTDALKIANQAIIKMGGSAEKLPQIMEIARKSVSIYGGDAKSNFEAISQAIANGNVRALRNYGITIDMTKAEKDFAAAHGVTANELSEVGKKQAILNAALEAGNERYKNINENTQSATTIMQTLKTTLKDIGETFSLVFEKTVGPSVRSFLSSIQGMATSLKLHIQSTIGDGAEAATAKLTLTQNRIKSIQDDITKLEKIKGSALDFAPAETTSRLQALTITLAKYKDQLVLVEKQNQEAQKSDDAASASRLGNIKKGSDASVVDKEKKLKQEAAFSKELEKIDKEYYSQQEKNIQSLDQVDALSKKRSEALEIQHENAVKAIKASADLTEEQKIKLLASEHSRYQESLRVDESTTAEYRKKLLDDYVKHSTGTFNGIERAFAANTQKMKLEQADFGKRGEEVWNSLSSNSTSALTNMGAQMAKGQDIGTAAADALKGVFLGMLGDRAIAEGNLLLLSSIWPPNPLGLAAGAGLLALGGALKSVAGASGAPSTSSGSPSVQATASGSGPRLEPTTSGAVEAQSQAADNLSTATPQMDQQQRVQRTVSVNIAGNYLETDQTKRMLMDLMRQESDSTGFNYNQIGA